MASSCRCAGDKAFVCVTYVKVCLQCGERYESGIVIVTLAAVGNPGGQF